MARFDWLREPRCRRSNLIQTRAAVAAGQLDAAARMDLVEVLADLVMSDKLSARELIGVVRVFIAIEAADARDPALRPVHIAVRPQSPDDASIPGGGLELRTVYPGSSGRRIPPIAESPGRVPPLVSTYDPSTPLPLDASKRRN